jgi:hypothetical protein
VLTGEDDINPLARQRQLVLDQHLDAAEAGLLEVGGERGQAGVPGAPFRVGRRVAVVVRHLSGQCRPQAPGAGEVGQARGGRTK